MGDQKETKIASQEFAIGKHDIGYVSSDFKREFGDKEVLEGRPLPTFQYLGRYMTDAQIESELKPGLCTLGDILAFLKNPPEGTKDGYANLFYTPSCVVSVRWLAGDGKWDVGTWRRGGYGWLAGSRVFSPAAGSETLNIPALESSGTQSLSEFQSPNDIEEERIRNIVKNILADALKEIVRLIENPAKNDGR